MSTGPQPQRVEVVESRQPAVVAVPLGALMIGGGLAMIAFTVLIVGLAYVALTQRPQEDDRRLPQTAVAPVESTMRHTIEGALTVTTPPTATATPTQASVLPEVTAAPETTPTYVIGDAVQFVNAPSADPAGWRWAGTRLPEYLSNAGTAPYNLINEEVIDPNGNRMPVQRRVYEVKTPPHAYRKLEPVAPTPEPIDNQATPAQPSAPAAAPEDQNQAAAKETTNLKKPTAQAAPQAAPAPAKQPATQPATPPRTQQRPQNGRSPVQRTSGEVAAK